MLPGLRNPPTAAAMPTTCAKIDEQPEALRKTLAGRLPSDSPQVAHVPEREQLLARHGLPQRVLITGCGTSFHAGLVAKSLIERWSRLPVEVDVASELRYRQPCLDSRTLVIVISQSGETADTLAALRMAKGAWRSHLALCNVYGSTIFREATATALTQAGPEIGVASTKAFTTQIALLSLIALRLGQNQRTPRSRASGRRNAEELLSASHCAAGGLGAGACRPPSPTACARFRAFLFLGRGGFIPSRWKGRSSSKRSPIYLPRVCRGRDEAWSDCADR